MSLYLFVYCGKYGFKHKNCYHWLCCNEMIVKKLLLSLSGIANPLWGHLTRILSNKVT
jgi:hypothetical protein